MMKKIVTAAVAALTLGGAAAATATPAAAQGWHGGYYHGGYRGWGPGAAVGAGLLGLAVGTAIAERPYAPAYYGPRPVYGYGYAPCGARLHWDPYVRHYVRTGYCY